MQEPENCWPSRTHARTHTHAHTSKITTQAVSLVEFHLAVHEIPRSWDPMDHYNAICHSAFNRNGYQKQEKMFLGSRAWPVRKADNLTAVSRLSRQYGIINISKPYRPPRPVTGTALLFILTSP
jgi:hypothetical protein